MTYRLTPKAAAAALACLATAFGPEVLAQALAQASAQPSGEIQTVVVTSQKRKEDIRQVPLSVSVLSGEALAESHINNFADLAGSVPNLSYSSQAGAGLSTLQMRGISSQAGSATVAVYLDDVSLTTRNLYSQGTAEPRFFDVDRVEVLRGPQGTLYGASALGGTLKFISKQPELKAMQGSAFAEVSSTQHGGSNTNLQGVLNVPLVKDSVALRLGVQSGKDSGYIDQVDVTTLKVITKGINSTRWDVVKLALKAQLGPNWSITPAVFDQRFRSGDIDASYLAVGNYQSANAGVVLPIFQTSKIVREPGKDHLTVPSLTLQGDLGFADMTTVLSGYQRKFDRTQDGTFVNSPYIGSVTTDLALGAKVGLLPSAVNLNNKVDQTAIEIRFASKDYAATQSPVTWIAGIFAARTKTEVVDDEPIIGINAAFKAAGRNIEDPAQLADSFVGAFLGDSSYYSARHYQDRQHSVFGELTFHASPSLRAIAGLRVLKANQHFTREGDRYYAGGPTSVLIDSSASAVTPRLALDWDMSPATTLYANIAKGFRLGSANRPVPLTPLVRTDLVTLGLPGTIPAAFKPDSLVSYEVGSKSRLLGGKLSLNVSAFYIDWKDIQQNVVLPQSGFDFETNVGKAHSSGFEAEAKFKATDALTLNIAGSVTRAVFAEDTPALGSDGAGVLNVRKGDWVQGVPRYGAKLGFDYRFRAFGDAGAFVRGSGQWTGQSHGSLVKSSPDYLRPAYFSADASAGLTLERWEFSAFMKNLSNTRTVIQQPSIQSVSTTYRLRPRTIGLTANLDF